MFSKRFIHLAAASALLAGATAAQAEISANVTVTSDYLFRGISQTDEKPAIQGGFDYAWDSGFYVGTWASNVNYGPATEFDLGTSTEFDYYGGFAGETDGGFGYDIAFIYFDYQGESSFDYQEIALGFSYGDLSFGVNYSNEYLGEGGPTMWYPYAGYSFGLGENLSLDVYAGYTTTDGDDFFGEDDSYADYHVALGTSMLGVDLSLGYYDTTLDDYPEADGRAVFSVSKSF